MYLVFIVFFLIENKRSTLIQLEFFYIKSFLKFFFFFLCLIYIFFRERSDVDTIVIEELQVFDPNVIIRDVKVMGGGLAGRKSLSRLAVMSDLEIRSLAVQRCDRAITCADCVALQDPYCAWDIRASRCSSGDWTSNMANR